MSAYTFIQHLPDTFTSIALHAAYNKYFKTSYSLHHIINDPVIKQHICVVGSDIVIGHEVIVYTKRLVVDTPRLALSPAIEYTFMSTDEEPAAVEPAAFIQDLPDTFTSIELQTAYNNFFKTSYTPQQIVINSAIKQHICNIGRKVVNGHKIAIYKKVNHPVAHTYIEQYMSYEQRTINDYLREHLPRLCKHHFNMPSRPAFKDADGYELSITDAMNKKKTRDMICSTIGGDACVYKQCIRMTVADYNSVLERLNSHVLRNS